MEAGRKNPRSGWGVPARRTMGFLKQNSLPHAWEGVSSTMISPPFSPPHPTPSTGKMPLQLVFWLQRQGWIRAPVFNL